MKLIPFSELRVGQIVADDLRSEKGLNLVRKNSEITEVILDRLIHFWKQEPILEPIKVIEPQQT